MSGAHATKLCSILVAVAAGCSPDESLVVTGFDVLAPPGREVTLRVKVERRDWRRADVGHPWVRFRLVHGPGAPKDLGKVRGDEDGIAAVRFRPAVPGDYEFRTAVLADADRVRAETELLLACRTRQRPMIAVDIDGTLTRSSRWWRTKRAEPYDAATVEVMQQLAQRYDVMYLTARHRFLMRRTRRWLRQVGLPSGPLFLLDPKLYRTALPETYKRRLLRRIRRDLPNLLIGIGNRESDADAYESAGMLPILIGKKEKEACYVTSWRQIGELLLEDELHFARQLGFQSDLNGREHRFELCCPPGGPVRLTIWPEDGPATTLTAENWGRMRRRLFAILLAGAVHQTTTSTSRP